MRTYKNIGFQFLVGMVCFFSTANTFAQWPQWRGPMRDGTCAETNLLKVWPEEGPRLAWSVNTIGDGFSSTAIQDEVVYTIGKHDSVELLTAIDLNGNIKWQKTYGRASRDKSWPQSRTTPTVYKNKVYAISVSGDVACFDCKSGNIDWKAAVFDKFDGDVDFGTAESPLVFDDKIIVTPCGHTTTMVALNRLTGETIWKSEAVHDSTGYSSPILIPTTGNSRAIFTSSWNYNLIVDCNTGKIKWKDQHVAGAIPMLIENQLYIPGRYGDFGTLNNWDDNWKNRSVKWVDSVWSNFMGGAVSLGNKIVVPDCQKGILCLDEKDGKTISRCETTNSCNMIVADDMLYTYEDKTNKVCLLKLNGNNLELVSSFKIKLGNGPCLAHLSIANGLLFVRRGAVLMAYNIKKQN